MSNEPCPRCGRTVAIDAPGGLCASCLLEAGAETYSAGSSSSDFMPTMSSAGSSVVARLAPRLTEGDRWGAYRIGGSSAAAGWARSTTPSTCLRAAASH